MFKFCLWLFLLLSPCVLKAQKPLFRWGTAELSTDPFPRSYNNGRTVGTDAQGNVYTAGLFDHTVDFDPGPGTFLMTGAASSEKQGIYLMKQDSNGKFIWAGQIGTIVELGQIELKVNSSGEIYLASYFRDSTDMDPGPGVKILTPGPGYAAFLVKVSSDGNLIWAKQFSGAGGSQSTSLDLDKAGNVVLTGFFVATIDFDPGPKEYNLTAEHFQAFILKLNSNGEFLWAMQFGNVTGYGPGIQIADVRYDNSGNICVVGVFNGECDFDPGPGKAVLTCSGNPDTYIAKLDGEGRLIWVRQIQKLSEFGYKSFTSRAIDVDEGNNIIICGYFSGSYDFDPGPAEFKGSTDVSHVNQDAFVLKLNSKGEFSWVRIFKGAGDEIEDDVSVDVAGNVYAIGSFSTGADLDPGAGESLVPASGYGTSALIKLSPSGNFVYGLPFTQFSALFRRLITDDLLNIYIVGHFSGTADFDPGPDRFAVSGTSLLSPFTLKLAPCAKPTASILNINACKNYTLDGEVFDSSGVYRRVLRNSIGCDSVVTLNLTITKTNTSFTKSICEGEFFFSGGINRTEPGVYVDTFRTIRGCDSIVTTTLMVHSKPSFSLGNDMSLCENTKLTLDPGQYKSYLWQDSSTRQTISVTKPGTYWVRVEDNFKCLAQDSITILSILPQPKDFLRQRDSICQWDNLVLSPVATYHSYAWSTGEKGHDISVNRPGQYWLNVTDQYGCKGADTIEIFQKECMIGFFMPNAFTPNADGRNDLIKPIIFGNVLSYDFKIYNRWGTLIFQSRETGNGWNGKVSGIVQANGSFVWVCTYELAGESKRTTKGTFTLIH